jgi:hypothetical protein
MTEIKYTDKEKILLHLLYFRSITNSIARKTYGISYPTTWIKELREEGCKIHDKWINQTNEVGKEKRIKMYYINKKRKK